MGQLECWLQAPAWFPTPQCTCWCCTELPRGTCTCVAGLRMPSTANGHPTTVCLVLDKGEVDPAWLVKEPLAVGPFPYYVLPLTYPLAAATHSR
jgi:hypothetical protein